MNYKTLEDKIQIKAVDEARAGIKQLAVRIESAIAEFLKYGSSDVYLSEETRKELVLVAMKLGKNTWLDESGIPTQAVAYFSERIGGQVLDRIQFIQEILEHDSSGGVNL